MNHLSEQFYKWTTK